MKSFKRISLLITLCLASVSFSQKRTEDFSISFPDKKLEKSYYKTITLIDNRIDTTSLGIVQKGAFNTKARVVPTTHLSDQFQKLLDHINGDNTEDGNIVIYLKQLYFAETTGAFSEHGYCYFQAFLFAKNDDGTYSYLDKIDQVIDHSSMDVTKATMKKGSEMVSDFISRNISKKAGTIHQYSFADLKNFDSIEKQKFSLYNSQELKDGVYKDYEAFRDQQPEKAITNVKFYGKAPKIIKIYETIDGKEKELKKDGHYAIVYKGEPYIYTSADDLFAKAEKRDGDYYFTGKVKSTAKTGNVMLASAFFGIIGGLIASGPVSTPFELKIDYLNGGFIPIREVKN
ncbi:hypothetical protein [Chryseobacterium gallinarum]|uniref:Uncharacterized protein n=1 Tax=Chryseobacterium gallinarum TaxID=1324352 RepID=A0A0G3M2H4_CHRGL|nr:hypothetical protein [Chryseobacterium gallinarum]AKK72203.1 hypothetical protein OK18_05725 [Chryseobacterium gallinarum]QIY92083.1 hypothetical protein FOB44_16110 [Chryseobacterium gallinarum]